MPRSKRRPARGAEEGQRGRRLGTGWEGAFFKYLDLHGTYYRAAEAAGVSIDAVDARRSRDPEFEAQCRLMRERHADSLEQALEAQAKKTGNPVGYIVRLKALRPKDYVERHLVESLNVSVSTSVTAEDAQALLRAMLREASPASLQALSLPLPIDTHVEDLTHPNFAVPTSPALSLHDPVLLPPPLSVQPAGHASSGLDDW
jgi:hypothetical protein